MLKDINGYEGLYRIDDHGNVYSIKSNKQISYFISNNGYKRVTLFKNGKSKNISIHRLVAIAFIPNPNDLPQVNHKDENKLNNNVDNLEWCSSKYNANYGTRIKRITEKNIESGHYEKLAKQQSEKTLSAITLKIVKVCKYFY